MGAHAILLVLSCTGSYNVFLALLPFSRETALHDHNMVDWAVKSQLSLSINEPAHVKIILTAYANSEGTGESAHFRSLPKAYAHSISGIRGSLRQRAGDMAPLDGCT